MQIKRAILIFLGSALLLLSFIPAHPSQPNAKISDALARAVQIRGLESQFTVWIYLTDKGTDIRADVLRLEESIPLKVMKRRLRQDDRRRLSDIYDLPLKERYVIKLMPYVDRIRQRSRWLNAVSAEVRGTSLEKISELPFISRLDTVKTFVYRDPEIWQNINISDLSHAARGHAMDYGPSFNQLDQINIPALHDMGYSGKGILICMLDTGFNNLDHKAFSHLDIRATWDFVNDDSNVDDEPNQMGIGNHGTNTLGTIGGFWPGELIGPAYGAGFILGKTENTEWERHIEEDHWVAAAEWAELLGADIISSSLGYREEFTHGESGYEAEDMNGRTAVVTLGANIAAAKGVLIVNSAGNEGRETGLANTIIAPADSQDVLAAGAVDPSGRRTDFSSYGPSSDGRIKPDVMAQGSLVYTAAADSPDGFVSVAGTSFSCPLASGAAALVLEANPTWSNRDIMAALKNTAAGADHPDNEMGWGILDAYRAAHYTVKNIHPPRSFAVESLENNYVFFTQFIDRLTWQHEVRNNGRISGYRIYERALGRAAASFTLIAELDADALFFERRGRLSDEAYLYKIISIGAAGEESDPDYARR